MWRLIFSRRSQQVEYLTVSEGLLCLWNKDDDSYEIKCPHEMILLGASNGQKRAQISIFLMIISPFISFGRDKIHFCRSTSIFKEKPNPVTFFCSQLLLLDLQFKTLHFLTILSDYQYSSASTKRNLNILKADPAKFARLDR